MTHSEPSLTITPCEPLKDFSHFSILYWNKNHSHGYVKGDGGWNKFEDF